MDSISEEDEYETRVVVTDSEADYDEDSETSSVHSDVYALDYDEPPCDYCGEKYHPDVCCICDQVPEHDAYHCPYVE
jgi:hypothetical protein